MTIIIDASAAIEIALKRPKSTSLRKSIANADWVIAPDLFVPEVTNVYWKLHHFKDLPLDICEKLLKTTMALPDDLMDSRSLYEEAFSMSCHVHHPVYDMLYLILARRNNGVLLTIDKGLLKIAKKQSVKTSLK